MSSGHPTFRRRSFIECLKECDVFFIPRVSEIHLLIVLLAWVALMPLS